ncbi:MBL fold metallo-hydrolase [Sphingomonas quercus]|uniref:MBL fold metallo-hydrolase n=1 Tax=Sphingomonas quercus TaxID=2842451 RepID=A0ABS6BFI8_9SPHN|nr:MBL fold metallo-hydrolase [Sphingomonas quercus]MBU3076251.1 MBL fold metallo-hydrolase [Sphingomonas quercus]
MRVRLLGTGTSSGVPRIGNDWGKCDPAEPKNRRRRASILVRTETTTILVDTSPDMREQLLDADCGAVDAVIWTHDHADHTHGIDDLRQLWFAKRGAIDCYARPETMASMRARFGYAFQGKDQYPPTVVGHDLPDDFTIGDIRIRVVDQPHGAITSAGLRFDWEGYSAGYSTDFNALTDEMAALFRGVEVWVLDALRVTPHPTHPNLEKALGWIQRLKPGWAVLMHMDNSMDYRTLLRILPDGVEPGYDGMELEFG